MDANGNTYTSRVRELEWEEMNGMKMMYDWRAEMSEH